MIRPNRRNSITLNIDKMHGRVTPNNMDNLFFFSSPPVTHACEHIHCSATSTYLFCPDWIFESAASPRSKQPHLTFCLSLKMKP